MFIPLNLSQFSVVNKSSNHPHRHYRCQFYATHTLLIKRAYNLAYRPLACSHLQAPRRAWHYSISQQLFYYTPTLGAWTRPQEERGGQERASGLARRWDLYSDVAATSASVLFSYHNKQVLLFLPSLPGPELAQQWRTIIIGRQHHHGCHLLDTRNKQNHHP